MSSLMKYECENCRHPGSIDCTLLNENSVAPVIRLAMGHPPSGSRFAAVWSCRKLNSPPGWILWKTSKRCQRRSAPTFRVWRPLTSVTESVSCSALSVSWSWKNVDPTPW
jgi:hypothetical protein